jgi:AcrR family transcriptional regulator
VLTAARELFTAQGYATTTVSDVARAAGVNVDTVYAAGGRKPQLLLAVIDMALGSSDEPVAAAERDYVKAVRSAPTARDKIATYAAALAALLPRIEPLYAALMQAAEKDDECAQVRDALVERRAANMRLLAAELRSTGEVRDDLTDEQVADVIWSMNAPEYFALLRSRGWSSEAYATLLEDVWCAWIMRPDDR